MGKEIEGGMYETKVLEELETNYTNADKNSRLDYNVDGCSCMRCGCFKSAWTIVLSPAGVAAGLAAAAAAATIDLGSKI